MHIQLLVDHFPSAVRATSEHEEENLIALKKMQRLAVQKLSCQKKKKEVEAAEDYHNV